MPSEIKQFPFYTGQPETPTAETPARLSILGRNKKREVSAYLADAGLIAAVNVALVLGQPLLLTGEAGTGKTQLAFSLARELGFEVLKFETKSTSSARDLFYNYDTLRRFHDAQLNQRLDGIDYITYAALGKAILRSNPKHVYERWLNSSFEHRGPESSIVLIDEIDKAPRDFPNDLLNEVEGMYFKIPELGMGDEKIEANPQLLPIVIITSNSEKGLPVAFLRRCIFYNIPFPKPERLTEIVLSHLRVWDTVKPRWFNDALDFFLRLREPNQLEKAPSTAELLDWFKYLKRARLGDDEHLQVKKEVLISSMSALCKTVSDQERATPILQKWLSEQSK